MPQLFPDTPKIDSRTYDDIVREVEDDAQTRTAQTPTTWTPLPDANDTGRHDMGGALIRVFARFAELIISRLNEVPDKNMLAFLDLIGVNALPPRAARVPLTFELAPGAVEARLLPIPAGTQVAAPPPKGQQEPVTFETLTELRPTTAKIVSAFARNESGSGDLTDKVVGENPLPFDPLPQGGDGFYLANQYLYVGWDSLPALNGAKLSLNFELSDANDGDWTSNGQQLDWSCSTEQSNPWKRLTVKSPLPGNGTDRKVDVQLEGDLLESMKSVEVNGVKAFWLRAHLRTRPTDTAPNGAAATVQETGSQIKSLTASLNGDGQSGPGMPTAVFSNSAPLNVDQAFQPFGAEPQLNDTLYISSLQAFGSGGAMVTLTFELDPTPVPPEDVQIAWQAWNGVQWEQVRNTSDQSEGLAKNGVITFQLPDRVEPTSVNGVTGNWVRAILVQGNYKTGFEYVLVDPNDTGQGYTLKARGGTAPKVTSIQVASTFNTPVPPTSILTGDTTLKSQPLDAPFAPFYPTADDSRTFYLGFDRPFSNSSVALFADVAVATGRRDTSTTPRQLALEYRSVDGWEPLAAIDGTNALTRTGAVSFIGPPDFVESSELNLSRYWLRLRTTQDADGPGATVNRLLTNTVLAAMASTIRNEVLGSGTGLPDQVLQLNNAPVLQNPAIEVRQLDAPSDKDLARIRDDDGEDVLTMEFDSAGRPESVWVHWQQVSDFRGSGPHDYHYTLDHLTGILRFGNGSQGRTPPQGRDNVRAASYRTGGGSSGNLPANSINQLKTAVPFVAKATNYMAADGGTDQEDLKRVARRGPTQLRHRGRATAGDDYVDLALEASSEIARAQVVPADFTVESTLGKVLLIVVPHGEEPRPEPGPLLVNRLSDYLTRRSPANITAKQIHIRGPIWRQVSVTATVVPTSTEVAATLGQRVSNALRKMLHPTTGGLNGRPWEFGQLPTDVAIASMIQGVTGVDHIKSLNATTPPASSQNTGAIMGRQQDKAALVASGTHSITVANPN